MKTVTSIVGRAGDRMLGMLVPRETAHANRYICAWVNDGCGYKSGCSGHSLPVLGMWQKHCCWDDYTGELLWCDAERQLCSC